MNIVRIELLFLGGAAVAFVFNVWATYDARVDLRELLKAGRNGLMKMAATAAAAREFRRTLGQLFLLLAGLSALTINEPPEPYRSSIGRLVARGLIVAFQLLLAFGAWQDRRARKAMIAYDAEHLAGQLESAQLDYDRREQ